MGGTFPSLSPYFWTYFEPGVLEGIFICAYTHDIPCEAGSYDRCKKCSVFRLDLLVCAWEKSMLGWK